MRHSKLIIAVLAFLALASAGCAKLKARDNLNNGVRAFRNAQFEDAIKYFNDAIQLDPTLTNAELYLGTAYAQQYIPGAFSEDNQKNADMAIQTFEKVLAREPNNTSAVAGLASMYQNTNQLEKSREFYLKNAGLSPDDPIPHYAVGSIDWLIVYNGDKNPETAPPAEEQLKLVEEGLQNLDKALVLNPEYEDAMSYKNLLLREKARLAATEEERTQLIAQADEWFNKALEARKANIERQQQGNAATQ